MAKRINLLFVFIFVIISLQSAILWHFFQQLSSLSNSILNNKVLLQEKKLLKQQQSITMEAASTASALNILYFANMQLLVGSNPNKVVEYLDLAINLLNTNLVKNTGNLKQIIAIIQQEQHRLQTLNLTPATEIWQKINLLATHINSLPEDTAKYKINNQFISLAKYDSNTTFKPRLRLLINKLNLYYLEQNKESFTATLSQLAAATSKEKILTTIKHLQQMSINFPFENSLLPQAIKALQKIRKEGK